MAKIAMETMLALLSIDLSVSRALSWPKIQTLTSQNGTQYGIVVMDNDISAIQTPKPTLITLTSTYEDALACNATGTSDPCYYSNACEFLVPAGWICASLDLPSHGSQTKAGEPQGIAGWRWRLDRQQNIVSQNNERVHDMLDDLIARGLTDGSRLAVSGISRGGLLAAHYMMADSRVHAAGLLSPVTNLTLLEEFDGYSGTLAHTLSLALPANAAQLADKNIWAIIGDQDVRVYTESLIQTMRQIQCTNCEQGPHPGWGCTNCPKRHGETIFRVEYEPLGHTVPPSSNPRPTFSALANWIQEKIPAKEKSVQIDKIPVRAESTSTTTTLLMIDEHHVLYRAGATRVLEPLTRVTPGVPAIAPTEPWEELLGYVSPHRVVDEKGLSQLWLFYQCYGAGMHAVTNTTLGVCLATSDDDGHTWLKPRLGVYPNTNVVFAPSPSFYFGSVLYEPDEHDAARKFKMVEGNGKGE